MIRKATNSDIKALLEIENESFNEFKLSKSSFYYHIKRNFLYVYELESDKSILKKREILGYCLVFSYLKIPRIYSIAVSKKARNLGIGSAMLEFLALKFKTLRLEVRSDNKAIHLYEKFGFKKVKILPNYYEDCDGILMIR